MDQAMMPAWTSALPTRLRYLLLNMHQLPDLEIATIKATEPHEFLRQPGFGRVSFRQLREAIGGFDSEPQPQHRLDDLIAFVQFVADHSNDPDLVRKAYAMGAKP